MTFPFKSLSLYKVKRTFMSIRSNNVFIEGSLIQYISSTSNHNEGIEICKFKAKDSSNELVWYIDEMDLENWESFIEPVPWLK